MGVEWTFEFDFPTIYEKLDDDRKKETMGRWSENIVKQFAVEV
jgi:hypothetical protein